MCVKDVERERNVRMLTYLEMMMSRVKRERSEGRGRSLCLACACLCGYPHLKVLATKYVRETKKEHPVHIVCDSVN